MAVDEDLAALRTVTTDLIDALTGIEERHWLLQTPCAEWNLRGLVDHVVGGNWYTVGILSGDTSEEALAATMTRFGGQAVAAAAAAESAVDQLTAFEQAGALDRSWNHVAGQLPGREILRLRLHDVIIHTWDINQTYRPPASIPNALAEWGLGELERSGSLMSKHFEIPSEPGGRPSSGDAAATYLQAFGR